MKKLIVFFLALFAVSCENKPQDDEKFKLECYKMSFDNQSGVQVDVVIRYESITEFYFVGVPETFVLQSNQKYSWDMYVPEYFTKTSLAYYPDLPLGRVNKIEVCFDKTVLVEYVSPKEDRNPAVLSNYVESGSDDPKYKKQWTYTFTVEDYQRAVKQNSAQK